MHKSHLELYFQSPQELQGINLLFSCIILLQLFSLVKEDSIAILVIT